MTLNPVVAVVNHLSQWSWHQVLELGSVWIEQLIFVPLQWPQAVVNLYDLSRNLAFMVAVVLAIFAAIRSMWPDLAIPGGNLSVPLLLERLVVASLISLSGIGAVMAALALNDAIVNGFIGQTGQLTTSAPKGVLSPFVVLLLALALIGLMLYLAVFYAMRTIEIYVLTAAIPWFAFWWSTSRDNVAFSNLIRELGVVIFIQTLHAAGFWLVIHLLTTENLGVQGVFLEVALLWYMTKLPGQFRRLVGVGNGVSALWR